MARREPHHDCILMKGGEPRVEPQGSVAVATRPEVDLNRCPSCEGNAHLVSFDERGYRGLRPCPGLLRDQRIDLFNAAQLPGRYCDATLSSFRPRRQEHPMLLDALERYLSGFEAGQRGRLFYGPVGTGKTHLLVASLRFLTLEKGISCRYVEFSHLLGDLRQQYAENKSEGAVLGPLLDTPVLAIDELGKGRANEFELRIIDALISQRYNNAALTTFFASNYTPTAALGDGARGTDTLADRIGERSESRIYEMCEFFPLTGSDYRVEKYRGGA